MVAAIGDRRVRVDGGGGEEGAVPRPPSLFALCRSWVQNDPDLGAPPPPPAAATPRPPLPLRSSEAAALLAVPPSLGAAPDALKGDALDELIAQHKARWCAVRQRRKLRAAARAERHVQRLRTLLPPARVAAAPPPQS